MISREARSQFTIFAFFPTSDDNTEMKGALVEAGYDSFVFDDQDLMIERVQQAAPHVLVFSTEALQTSLSDFVSRILEANSEVQFICVSPVGQADALSEYKDLNFAALVPLGDHLPIRAVWALDQVCEILYRLYQNEELLRQNSKAQVEIRDHLEKILDLESRQSAIVEFDLAARVAAYENASSKDDFLTIFLKSLPCRALYFKFLPTVSSFVATFAQGLDVESVKGVGSRLEPDENRNLMADLMANKLPKALQDLMQNGLGIRHWFFKPVPVYQGLDGLFIFWSDAGFRLEQIENDFLIFHLLYQKAHLMKKSESLDVYDPVTELYNRNFFFKKLEEEIARARRLVKAVSVIRLSIDHLDEIDRKYGRSNRDLILRTIGGIVKKTSRVNDMSCRTDENEISLILPHCARKGAALRAERLRRIIEGQAFPFQDIKVTISCGVSEYPSLSKGATDLEASASQALEFIANRGGNKVCLFKPIDDFKPDFEVPPM